MASRPEYPTTLKLKDLNPQPNLNALNHRTIIAGSLKALDHKPQTTESREHLSPNTLNSKAPSPQTQPLRPPPPLRPQIRTPPELPQILGFRVQDLRFRL